MNLCNDISQSTKLTKHLNNYINSKLLKDNYKYYCDNCLFNAMKDLSIYEAPKVPNKEV
jgi:hypothetical protein